MANFIVPKDPEFNVGNVPEIKESDFIIASFVNSYYQIFLNNMQALKNMVESKATEGAIQEIMEKIGEVDGSISETFERMAEEIDLKAPLNSPVFSGNPRVPKASAGTNTLQAASTSFVTEAVTNMMNAFKSTILKTMAEVSANTNPDNIPSAKVVAELNNNLGGLSFGIDGDGNYGYYGADGSLIPFKSTSIYYLGTALSFNIKELLPNVDYTSLTSNNFIVQTTGFSGGSVASKETKNAEHINIQSHPPYITFPSISYNATTGVVSVNRGGARSYVWADCGVGGFYSNMAYSSQKVYLAIW